MGSLTPLPLGPDELGECPRWIDPPGQLWRVDILAGLVHRVDLRSGAECSERFEGEVGFALPRADGGMVVGEERRLWLLDDDGARTLLLELDERKQNRFNDAICDARGRLWAGTFARDRHSGAANLYRIDPDGSVERVLSGLTIANGLGWLEGGTRLHFVDSPAQELWALEVEVEAGRLSGRRTVVAIDPDDGAPDGICVDAEGGTWVALFAGGAIRRYDRDGALTEELRLPVPHVTAPCIGGPSGLELFATTTRHRLSAAERLAFPDAGRVFRAEVSTTASAFHRFLG